MARAEWIVHPNRSEVGADEPGRNGHFRAVPARQRTSVVEPCRATVKLPRRLATLGDGDGTVTFGGYDWWFVVGAGRTFSRTHISSDVVAPFGFQRSGKWWWWDDTTTGESILDGPDGIDYVREYFEVLFPGLSVTVTDHR